VPEKKKTWRGEKGGEEPVRRNLFDLKRFGDSSSPRIIPSTAEEKKEWEGGKRREKGSHLKRKEGKSEVQPRLARLGLDSSLSLIATLGRKKKRKGGEGNHT